MPHHAYHLLHGFLFAIYMLVIIYCPLTSFLKAIRLKLCIFPSRLQDDFSILDFFYLCTL